MSGPPAWAASPTAIAPRLATEGAAVAIFDRDDNAATSAANKLAAEGRRVLGLAVDVTNRTRIDEAGYITGQVIGVIGVIGVNGVNGGRTLA